MWARIPLAAILYLFLGVAALALPLYLVVWAQRGSDESGRTILALLCIAIVCLAISLIQSFRLVCRLRRAQDRIAAQNSDLERQSVALESTNEELKAQQVELEHTANNLIGTNILLLQSSRRFQELFQGVPIACYCYDRNGSIIEWNRACETLYGFPTDEIFERKIWETICGPNEIERAKEIVERVFAGESFEGMEWTNLRADGSECRVLCSTFPLRAHDGAILGAISANIDITERSVALDALAENEERYRRLVEHTPDAIAVLSAGKVAYFNPSGMSLFGARKPEEILGKTFIELIHPAYIEPAEAWLKETEQSKSSMTVQQKVVRLDGRVVDVEATAISTTYRGRPATQIVIRDITARLRAESLLHQQSAAMEASIDGCALLDQKGNYIFLNQAHAQVYGYENVDELLGKSWRILYDEEELKHFDDRVIPQLIRDGHWRGEAIGRKKDSSIFHQEISLTLIEGGGMACVVRDITERKQAEEKLQYIMSGAQCLLWAGTVVDVGDRLVWNLSMPDEEAAQRFLPLDVEPGQTYGDAWYTCRLPEDQIRTDQFGSENTRAGRSYSQEFRCRRSDGEIRWMAEDVGVESLGAGKWRAVGVCTDITERKRVEEMFRSITNTARCLLWEAIVIDVGGNRLDWSIKVPDEAAASRFLPLEMRPGETYDSAWYRSRIDEDRERCDQFGDENVKAGKSYSQEFRCRRIDGEIRWLAEDVAVEMIAPGKWRVVGVCLDITERKHAEKVSRSVTEAALCLLWEAEIVDEGGERTVWYMSMMDETSAQRFLPLNIEPGQSYVDAWYLSRLEDDRIECDRRSDEALRINESYSQEFRCRRADGEIRWLAEDVAIEITGPGKWRAVGVCIDITERKRAEEISRSIVDAARCLLWEATVELVDGRMVWNMRLTDEDSAQRFLPLNVAPGQSYTDAWYVARLEEDRSRTNAYGREKVLANQSYSQEFRCRRVDGEIRWLVEDVAVEPLGPNRWRTAGICMDITERKRAEEMSRSIVEAGRCLLWEAEIKMVDGKMRWDFHLTDEDAAQRFLPLNIEPGQTYHDAWYYARFEEDRARMSRYGREKIQANQSYSQEFRCRRADGEIRWLAEDVAVEQLGPERWRAVGVCLDITERKRAEEMSRSIVDAARCLLWEAEITDYDGILGWKVQIFDDEAARRFLPLNVPEGGSYSEAWNMSRHPDDRKRIDEHASEMIRAGKNYSQEFRCIASDGETHWLTEEVAVEEMEAGRWRAVGVCIDITERKRAEEVSHSIVDAARCLLWEASVELIDGELRWDLRMTNEEAAQRFLPVEPTAGESYTEAWHRSRSEEDIQRLNEHSLEKITSNQNYSQEFRCRRADGEIRWLAEEVVVEPQGPNKWRTVGVCVDVTERKRAEERLRYIMASAHCLFWDAIVTDQGGTFSWDIRISDEDAAQRLLPLYVPKGRTYNDAWINSRLEEDHIRMADTAQKEIRAGRGYSQEFRCRRRDGEIRWLEEDVTVETIGPGRWHAVGVCLDITERKKAESVLRDDVQRFSSIIATQYDIVKAKLDLNRLLNLTVERVQKLTGAAGAAIGMAEGETLVWRTRKAKRLEKAEDNVESSFAQKCLLSGEIVYCPDLKAAARTDETLATDLPIRSIIAIPLHHNQKVTGVLIAHSNETYAFGERNMQTLQLMAGLISTAIEHASEFEEKQALLAERTSALTALQDSEARFKAFMDNTPAVAFMKDVEGRRVWVNNTYEKRFQKSLADLIGKTDFDLYPKDIADNIQKGDQVVLEGNKPTESKDFIPMPANGMRYFWSFRFPFQDRTGQRFLGGVAFDITEQKMAEDALRESEERFRLAINSIHEGLVLMDAEGRIQLFNQSAERILGQIAEQILVDQPFEPGWRMIGENGKEFDENDRPIEVTLRTGKPQRDVVVGVRKPSSETVWISFNTVPLFRPGEDKPYAAVASFTDITERRRVAQQLQEQMQIIQKAHATLETQQAQLVEANTKLKALATLDGLTGLKNHRAFQEKLEAEFQRATQSNKPISLLLLDVDMFKLYNDTFGHLAGDEVLKSVARLLRENARGSDFVARYGGEEFVVIVPRADREKAIAVAERFRRAIEGAPWIERQVTASFGVATIHPEITAPSQLIADADRALYAAKAGGRNRVTHISDIDPDSQQSVIFRHWRDSSDQAPSKDSDPPAQAA
jgi:diguanylate cyclase (GGDEF)-like protein/PAS domain S-box-containing protein